MAIISFSGDLGNSLDVLRNGRLIQTVTGFEYYIDGDSPNPNVNYSVRIRDSVVATEHNCLVVDWPPPDNPPPSGPACEGSIVGNVATLLFSGNLGTSANLLRNSSWLATVTGLGSSDDTNPPPNATYLLRTRNAGVVTDTECVVVRDPSPPSAPMCDGSIVGHVTTLLFSGDLGSSANLLRNGSWLATVTGLGSTDDTNPPPNASYLLRTRTAGVVTDTECAVVVNPSPPSGPMCDGSIDGNVTTLVFSGDLGTSANLLRNGSWLTTVTGQASSDDTDAPPNASYLLRTRTAGVVTDTECDIVGNSSPPSGPMCEGSIDGNVTTLLFSGDLGSSANLLRNGSWLATVTGQRSSDDTDPPPNASYLLRTRPAGVVTDTACVFP